MSETCPTPSLLRLCSHVAMVHTSIVISEIAPTPLVFAISSTLLLTTSKKLLLAYISTRKDYNINNLIVTS